MGYNKIMDVYERNAAPGGPEVKEDDRIEKYCKYCEHAGTLSDPDAMLCDKAGVVSASHCCRRFRYDPMKRKPRRRADALEALEDLPFAEV